MVKQNIGKVVQVIGPVLDVEFEADKLPELYNALTLEGEAASGGKLRLTAEVQQHIGRNQVRRLGFQLAQTRGLGNVERGTGGKRIERSAIHRYRPSAVTILR